MSLLESTRRLLRDHIDATGKSVAEIAKEVGAPVRTEWLMKLKNGEIEHPSVVRIEALHDFLKSKRAVRRS